MTPQPTESEWDEFAVKLSKQTAEKALKWRDAGTRLRDNQTGPLYVAEILPGKHVGIYRLNYELYTDVDEYVTRPDVAIELVTQTGNALWRLPAVDARFGLMDQVEFAASDAQRTLTDFMGNGE